MESSGECWKAGTSIWRGPFFRLMTHPWRKESLDLTIGDWIIWKDAEIKSEDGPVCVSSGMKGKVVSLHEGAHLDLIEGGSLPAKAVIQLGEADK